MMDHTLPNHKMSTYPTVRCDFNERTTDNSLRVPLAWQHGQTLYPQQPVWLTDHELQALGMIQKIDHDHEYLIIKVYWTTITNNHT